MWQLRVCDVRQSGQPFAPVSSIQRTKNVRNVLASVRHLMFAVLKSYPKTRRARMTPKSSLLSSRQRFLTQPILQINYLYMPVCFLLPTSPVILFFLFLDVLTRSPHVILSLAFHEAVWISEATNPSNSFFFFLS